MRPAQLLIMGLLFGATPTQGATQEELLSMSLDELVSLDVSIATGTPKSLRTTPGATSIITAAELESMGAQDIDEALEMVPGLHVSHSSFIYASRYFIRGIVSTYNPHTLLLVNGIPQTSLFTGDRGERMVAMTGLPVSMIERIEIIRGPGSAVYGADAFAGVINIITRKAGNAPRGQATVSHGSFDTGRASVMQNAALGPVQALLSLAVGKSEGDNPVIASDLQSSLDTLFGTSASLAPGPANLAWENLDIRSDLQWDDFLLRLSWRRSEGETGQGINESLDPAARFPHHHGTVDLTWSDPYRWAHWQPEIQLSYLYSDFRNPTYIRQYPPGAFGGLFPDGMLQKPELSEENARINVTALYTGLDGHRIRIGAGSYWGDIFKTTDAINYQLVPGNPIPQPVPLHEVSDTPEAFLPENQRTAHHVFVQDEWQLANDWELTAGIRHDDYSDIGGATNPRLALVWSPRQDLTTKLMYGEAFRPPAFFELYARNNPVALGNPQLKPEKLKSAELALSWEPMSSLVWDLNLYTFRIHDFIDFVDDPGSNTFTAQNTGRIRGNGVETELRHQLRDNLQLLVNYSYQHARDQDTDAPLGLAPDTDASLRLSWRPGTRWQVTPQAVWLGPTRRPAGDTRQRLDGHATLDLTVRHQWRPKIALTLVIRNLFDADAREASRGPEGSQTRAAIPDDLPQASRSATLQATAHW
ncbi:MAG: TonB-dependent receptor plug domain-containing protein [Gammaproteobacteria bacterium]